MKIRDIMTPDTHVIGTSDDLRKAAQMMRTCDVGSLPVHDGEKLVGMLTDRDIVLRAVAEGVTEGRVEQFMSTQIKYCYDDEDADAVARNMAELAVRRLPVVDRDKRLVGMVSLSNLTQTDGKATDEFLQAVAQPH
ncbi:MAG TPA: CBS domain-containing protein [Dokdonella sp.]|uniref:CBS domain-containing protein n=1 Tax=Dokdonella sp. TaxID=2291710 RepID=UPI002C64FA94|nr:CBS domain-containing protein [Dokdonella sp.]HUD40813.1 CBS domain-containing protein [Dokdonella sp.]